MSDKKIRILLIEDDRLDQLAFKGLVDQIGEPYDYKIASSVAQAQEMIDPENFDIIIADYDLGDGTIFDVIDFINNIPIIITTGGGGEAIAAKAMGKGAFDYLIKDIDRNYLKVLPVIIENAIKNKKADDQIKMLSHAMMNISDSVFITDIKNEIIFVNKSFCETYGYSEKEILNRSPEFFQTEFIETNPNEKPKPNEDMVNEYTHFRKNGNKFPVSMSQSNIVEESDKVVATVWVAQDITERKRTEEGMKKLVSELQDALAKVRTLSGFIPICASCKKIRDDQGYWNQIEQYIKDHSEAEFSHSMCPDCKKEFYPDLGKEL
jgi:PAS domain S-box-containing protein